MQKYILLIMIFIGPSLFADESVQKENNWIKPLIDYTINTRFQEAENFIVDRINSGDSTYHTYFYYASILSSKMTHYENWNEEPLFLQMIARVINITDSLVMLYEAGDDSTENMADIFFYRGSAYGYLAYFQGQKGQWYKALNNGMQSVDDLDRVLEIDSTMWDAYLGLGVYKYWKSTKLKFVLWLPFISDRREEGIEDIRISIENNCNSQYLAIHQLVYILCDHGDYNKALEYAKLAIEAYPQSQFMWWAYAHCYYKNRDNQQAIEAYQFLLNLIENDPQANPMHWVAIQIRFAEIYKQMARNDKVDFHCRLVLEKNYPHPIPDSAVKNMQKARDLLQEIEEDEKN